MADAPCVDCGGPMGGVRRDGVLDSRHVYWCDTCKHRYRPAVGLLPLCDKAALRLAAVLGPRQQFPEVRRG